MSRDVKEVPWVITEPTRVKHQILDSYIGKWMGILFNQQKKINEQQFLLYFDGFAGPGTYWLDGKKQTKVPGSPIIVADIANSYLDADPERNLVIMAIDKNRACVDMLNQLFGRLNRHNQYWQAYDAEFEDAVKSLFDQIEKKDFHIPPMFVFIDPFWYAGFSMKTLERLLSYPRIELFITLMIYDIVRFCDTDEHETAMYDLFGVWDFKKAREQRTPEKKQLFLKNLYCHQLKHSAMAQFVMPFRVNTPDQAPRPRYYLVHASNHIKALKEMKNTMHSMSHLPFRFEAIGLVPEQLGLFEDPEQISLRERIQEFCREQPKELEFGELEDWAYANTGGVRKIIQTTLIGLADDGVIQIMRKPRQRKTTITEGASISYLLETGVQK